MPIPEKKRIQSQKTGATKPEDVLFNEFLILLIGRAYLSVKKKGHYQPITTNATSEPTLRRMMKEESKQNSWCYLK